MHNLPHDNAKCGVENSSRIPEQVVSASMLSKRFLAEQLFLDTCYQICVVGC